MAELHFQLIDGFLLFLAAITAVAVIEARNLLAATIMFGFYSLLMALVWQNMDAVDVSFTEAAVGAGISTVLLLGALVIVGRHEKERPGRVDLRALAIVGVTGAALIFGTFDMPRFGDPQAPLHTHRAHRFLTQDVGKSHPHGAHAEHAAHGAHAGKHGHRDGEAADPEPVDHASAHPDDDWHGHVPNTVTSVLAGYRSFDTMMETAVIFTAGMSLVLLLRRRRRPGGEGAT